jgi:dihydrolipoamide dehydrogenase
MRTEHGPSDLQTTDILVIGSGPAGVVSAIRSAELGARTALISSGAFGGMAANDGPVPVRTLAHAARLMREAQQMEQYGVLVAQPKLDYKRLVARARAVSDELRGQINLRHKIHALGVTLYEHTGHARFVDPFTVETQNGLRIKAKKIVLCTGGVNRRLAVPGVELTSTHSDAWGLNSVPTFMLVIGAGATGAQVASIFTALGSKVQLFEAGPRILPTEDETISAAAAEGFRQSGMVVREGFGRIQSFEKTANGVRMNFEKDGLHDSAEADVVVMAIGWVPDTGGLNLSVAGVALDPRGFVKVNEYLQTSAPHIFAAGDITGRMMLVPQALQGGYVAASNAVRGSIMPLRAEVSPTGSFTEPEYARVGLTEAEAKGSHEVLSSVITFDKTARTIIDGRTFGFCKLIVDRSSGKMLGCHVIGERAVDIVEVAATAISAGMRVDEFARIPLSYPTYAEVLVEAAVQAAQQLGIEIGWQAHETRVLNAVG